MLINCPYPDCSFTYELEIPSTDKHSLQYAYCPNCGKEGSARSPTIVNLLQKRYRQTKQNQINDRAFDKQTFLVLLEDIRSLWNVGSIFRTADASGVSMLYLCGITGCPPQKQISKTALGAEESIPWQYLIHPLDIIPTLKSQGVCVVGLERNANSDNLSKLLKEKEISKPLCLIVGNENQGLSPETLHYCNYICSLPMKGKKESLNAAVAFGVAAYLINEFT